MGEAARGRPVPRVVDYGSRSRQGDAEGTTHGARNSEDEEVGRAPTAMGKVIPKAGTKLLAQAIDGRAPPRSCRRTAMVRAGGRRPVNHGIRAPLWKVAIGGLEHCVHRLKSERPREVGGVAASPRTLRCGGGRLAAASVTACANVSTTLRRMLSTMSAKALVVHSALLGGGHACLSNRGGGEVKNAAQ